MLNNPNARITRYEPTKAKTAQGGKRHQKNSLSINNGFTSVLENMRGKHDKHTNARLRSAFVTAAAGSTASSNKNNNNIKIYRENAQGVKYESLTIANKSPILNP